MQPALAEPSRITECQRCPWWPTCEAELERAEDVSLVVRGEVAVALREVGVRTVAQLAALDPAAEPPIPLPGVPFADVVALARARQRGLAVVRRVPRVPVLRADVEVDVDMESFGEAGAYLWGVLLRYPGGALPATSPTATARSPPGSRCPPTTRPARSPSSGAGSAACAAAPPPPGRTFAAYCYNEQAENRWLLASADRFAGLPGIPPLGEVEAFIADECWVDLFAVVSEWFLCAHGQGAQADRPGRRFHLARPGGRRGELDALVPRRRRDGRRAARCRQRERLLEYNADDVAATHALREWMTSPSIEQVPLAAEL